MAEDDPYCPECGEPVGRSASYCIHCSADLTEARDPTGEGNAAGSPGATDEACADTVDSRLQDDAHRDGSDQEAGQVTDPSGNRLLLIGVCLGLTVGGIVLGVIVINVIGITLIVSGVDISDTDQLVLSLVGIQGIAFPGVSYAYFRYKGRSLRSFIPVSVPKLRETAVVLGSWIGAFVLVMIGLTIALSLFGAEPAGNQAGETAAENPEFIPFLIPLVFLLNAPGEELLFRGVIQGLFRERFGPAAAILLATAMFAPIHIISLVGAGLQSALVTISILSLPSIVFGAAYEYTDNFLVPTLVHALYNATLFGLLFISSSVSGEAGLLLDFVVLL
jgi:membrane protease YdiL (CAAX protease family)